MTRLSLMQTATTSPELSQMLAYKESGHKYKERRHEDWTKNYTLYRDKVEVNRLEQRQSVHIPLMKQTIKTLLKDVDDMPVIQFENLDNDKQKELFQNEYWKWTVDKNKMEIKDIVDKKQVMIYGRSFDQMQIVDGKVTLTIIDPEDILVDRYCDPTDIDTSRFLIHTHIFKPLSWLEKNDGFDKTAVSELVTWHKTDEGLIKANDNLQMMNEKNERLETLGVSDTNDPVLGETIAELSYYFVYDKKPGDTEEQLYLKVEADDYRVLMAKPLEQVLGVTKDHYWRNHFNYNTWADDIEMQDFWSDSIADIVRGPNVVLDAWYSQLVENRVLRNFGMHYYNSNIEGFQPQTFNPVPWGWYGIPLTQGQRISDILQKVEIPELSESLDEMQYVMEMAEKATGATATQQGEIQQRQVTLGEVQLALGEAKERIKGMSKFYTQVWRDRAEKFLKLIEGSADKLDVIDLYKKGRNTDAIYKRTIDPTKDLLTDSGYSTRIWSQDDKNETDSKKLERLNAAIANMPNNNRLKEEFQRSLLEFAGLSPEKINEIVEEENQKMKMMTAFANQTMTAQGITPPGTQPTTPSQVATPSNL